MTRLPAKFYAGQNDNGTLYYICDSLEGIFVWSNFSWERFDFPNIREALKALGIKKPEALAPADLPLFVFRPSHGH